MGKFTLIAAICLAAGATMSACDRQNPGASSAAVVSSITMLD